MKGYMKSESFSTYSRLCFGVTCTWEGLVVTTSVGRIQIELVEGIVPRCNFSTSIV